MKATLNVFADLEQGIESRVVAWLLPARHAQVVGMIGLITEQRKEEQAEASFVYRLGHMVKDTWNLKFPFALLVAATVLDELIQKGSTVIAPFEQQLAEAKFSVGELPTGTPTPPPAVPSVPPVEPLVTGKPPGMLTKIIGAPEKLSPQAPTS